MTAAPASYRAATAAEHRARCACCAKYIATGDPVRVVLRTAAPSSCMKSADRLVCACVERLSDREVHAYVDQLYLEWLRLRERYAMFAGPTER